MTPSEKLKALAEERANSPENMKEMLALVLDRATSATVSRINYEIGHDVQLHPHYYKGRSLGKWRSFRTGDYGRSLDEYQNISADERRKKELGQPTDYEMLLKEYVELKLYLHSLRRAMYYPYDAYAEREGDFTEVLDRCREIRRKIKELRGEFTTAAWGEFAPEPRPTVYDKPLLHAFNDYQCSSFIWTDATDTEPGNFDLHCPLAGEYWYAGLPYCREHQHEARKDAKQDRRAKQQQAKARYRTANMYGDWSVAKENPTEPCTYRDPYNHSMCQRTSRHAHYGGRIEFF